MQLFPYLLLLLLSSALQLAVAPPAPPPLLDGFVTLDGWTRAGVGLALGALGGLAIHALLRYAARVPAMRAVHTEIRAAMASDRAARLGVVVFGPIAEELFFRGVLLPYAGVTISAVAFAAAHVRRRSHAWLWPLACFAFGVLAGGAYLFTGTLLAPIALHVVANLRAASKATLPRRQLGGLLG